MHKIKKIYTFVVSLMLLLVLGVGAFMVMFPDVSATVFGYRIYCILSDSMEPEIPVDSLVLVRTLKNGAQPLHDEVITFEADRFGQPIILTHIYDKSELIDGNTYYRTHPVAQDSYDPYDTSYDDIKGVYVTHIPYIGRFMLFIGSSYGICLLLISFFVLCLYQYISEHFNLDEEVLLPHARHTREHHEDEAILVKNVVLSNEYSFIMVSGELINATSIALKFVRAKFIFLDENDCILSTKLYYLVARDVLDIKEHRTWTYEVMYDPRIKDVYIEIISAKKQLYNSKK